MAKTPTKFFQQGSERCQQVGDTIVTRQGVDENGAYVRLFTGGWNTLLTKNRINDVLQKYGACVYQERGQWYVTWFNAWDRKVKFHEGIKVYDEPGKVG